MESILSLLTPKKMTHFIDSHSTLRQALEKFDAHKFSVIPVLDEKGKYVGTLSEGDILRYFKKIGNFDLKEAEMVRVNEIEHYRPYQALKIDTLMVEVFTLALEQNFVPILDDNDIYIGIIKRREVLKHLFNKTFSEIK